MVVKGKKRGEGREFPRMINFSTTEEMRDLLNWIATKRSQKQGRVVSVSEVIRDMVTLASKKTVKELEDWERSQGSQTPPDADAGGGCRTDAELAALNAEDDAREQALYGDDAVHGPLTEDDLREIQGEARGDFRADQPQPASL